MQDTRHIVAQKFKEIRQLQGESIREYDKRFKDYLIQITYTIDEQLLVQWFVAGLL